MKMKSRIGNRNKQKTELREENSKLTALSSLEAEAVPVCSEEVVLDLPSHLSNLSLRSSGQRPAWFDFEPLALRSRTRACRRILQNILGDHEKREKSIYLIRAEAGMGKTAFLAELYRMLERAPGNVLVLAPAKGQAERPLSALRSILEQRFYISHPNHLVQLQNQLQGAVEAIVKNRELGERIVEILSKLWRTFEEPSPEANFKLNIDLSHNFSAFEAMSMSSAKLPRQRIRKRKRTETTPGLPFKVRGETSVRSSFSEEVLKEQELLQPPQLGGAGAEVSGAFEILTQGVSQHKLAFRGGQTDVFAALSEEVLGAKQGKERDDKTGEEPSLPEEVAGPTTDLSELIEAHSEISEIFHILEDPAARAQRVEEEGGKEDTGLLRQPRIIGIAQEGAVALQALAGSKSEAEPQSEPALASMRAEEAVERAQNAQGRELASDARKDLGEEGSSAEPKAGKTVPATEAAYVWALSELFKQDLQKNSLAIFLDDVDRYDRESLSIFAKLYQNLSGLRLSYILTLSTEQALPALFEACELQSYDMPSLSDHDVQKLTQHVLEQLSKDREKPIVPEDICRLIAQAAFGSPARAIEFTLNYFRPEQFLHWSEGIEFLRRLPPPPQVWEKLESRLQLCSELERQCLNYAAVLNAPFSSNTLAALCEAEGRRVQKQELKYCLYHLENEGFLSSYQDAQDCGQNRYLFKHEYERLCLVRSSSEELRSHVYGVAAQWYAMNNEQGLLDESIGDLWRNHQSMLEACHYYERAAYRALREGKYAKAWPLLLKVLSHLPAHQVARYIELMLETAVVAYRMGRHNDAFLLNREASQKALSYASYSIAARAQLQSAEILMERGSFRKAKRYLAQARMQHKREYSAQVEGRYLCLRARMALLQGRRQESLAWIARLRQGRLWPKVNREEQLRVKLLQAEWQAKEGALTEAEGLLKEVVNEAKVLGDHRLQSLVYRSLGLLYYQSLRHAQALEAWNKSLGMAQEMNDVILHAELLCDIAVGALSLKAYKTTRSAIEQSQQLAMTLKHKVLLARCLRMQAQLQYSQNEDNAALDAFLDAQHLAQKLGMPDLIEQNLEVLASFYGKPEQLFYDPPMAERLYQKLFVLYQRRAMPLAMARLWGAYAEFLLHTHQNAAAMSAYKRAQKIYAKHGQKRASAWAQSMVERLSAHKSKP